MGPLLRNWLGLEIGAELHDEEFRWWRRCVRRGITAREVQRWSDRGMPYPLLVAAPGIGLQLGPVLALAKVMRSAGAWDGLDRRALTDLIGYHVEIMAGTTYPVLDRWLTLPLPQVRDQVATAVSRADLDLPYARVEARASLAAERVLYDLEAENALKGYRRRSPKVIDPSWNRSLGRMSSGRVQMSCRRCGHRIAARTPMCPQCGASFITEAAPQTPTSADQPAPSAQMVKVEAAVAGSAILVVSVHV